MTLKILMSPYMYIILRYMPLTVMNEIEKKQKITTNVILTIIFIIITQLQYY